MLLYRCNEKAILVRIEVTSVETCDIRVKRSTDEENTYDLLLRITI